MGVEGRGGLQSEVVELGEVKDMVIDVMLVHWVLYLMIIMVDCHL